MTQDEAKSMLLKHAEGLPAKTPTTLLESLRPYRGIRGEHYLEILEALLVVAPTLREPKVDREILHAIWELCSTARTWTRGPHEPMHHGRDFISTQDKETLDEWIGEYESITLLLLRGEDEWVAFLGMPGIIAKHELASRATFLAPIFIELLRQLHEDEGESGVCDAEDGEVLCRCLAGMGDAAKQAVPLLQWVEGHTKFPSLRSAAKAALSDLE